jgi:hypothetical protein
MLRWVHTARRSGKRAPDRRNDHGCGSVVAGGEAVECHRHFGSERDSGDVRAAATLGRELHRSLRKPRRRQPGRLRSDVDLAARVGSLMREQQTGGPLPPAAGRASSFLDRRKIGPSLPTLSRPVAPGVRSKGADADASEAVPPVAPAPSSKVPSEDP